MDKEQRQEANERTKKWQKDNKERVNAKNRKWRLDNPNETKKFRRKFNLKRRKTIYGKDEWAYGFKRCIECGTTETKHQAKGYCVNCYCRLHRHKPHIKEWYKSFSREPHRRWLVKQRKKRLRGRGTFTIQEWEELKKKYNYTCPACNKREPEIKLTIDHIIPIIKDGMNVASNIQPLCGSCNSRKNATTRRFPPPESIISQRKRKY